MFEKIKQRLLTTTALDDLQLNNILNLILSKGSDFADLYFQMLCSEAWVLDEGIVKTASYDIDKGVGIRAITGEMANLAYSTDLSFHALQESANVVSSLAKNNSKILASQFNVKKSQSLYDPINPLSTLTSKEKVELLQSIDREARQQDSRVSQVTVRLSAVDETILIANSEGCFSGDIRPLIRLNVSVIVESNGRRESGFYGGGGRCSYQLFLQNNSGLNYAKEAVRKALINLESIEAPAGNLPVVLGPGWPGVLLHESIGHGLEGDFNRKGSSAFSGCVGEKVASSICTVVDDATLNQRRGSLNIDDEGVLGQYTTLIENGILSGYMHDKLNAKIMNVNSTGNGRRESYQCLPIPRMTNTYLLPGLDVPEDIIKSVSKGIYAVDFAGGQVDITSGKFVFTTSEAYLIENGKITAPVKNATLIGNGPDVLTKISMIGNDLSLDSGVGICGKDGQSVPVCVGQPTIKIDELTLGGTNIA